jgi:predicted TIM-barrel fold metal-dependent hydrolase
VSAPARAGPLAGREPLIEVHAHFLHGRCGRKDWQERNASRLRAGERIGITVHVASILGTWGHTSPVYFPSPADVTLGNTEMLALQRREGDRVRSYVTVNPNETEHALSEIERCLAQGAVGIKLAASRRADDALLDPIGAEAARRGVPVLHHIWQHRRRDWPGQEASDGVELARLAARHPRVSFILAHIGGGGDWQHTLPAIRDVPNVYVDLSGSGVDRGMLDRTLAAVGVSRVLWGSDLTMETGLAKLWALEVLGLSAQDLASIRWGNAARIFPPGSFPALKGEESTSLAASARAS